ncbi:MULTISPECIES: metallophosphoesterase family protein [Mycolicibacterium]|jgi:predicted phosphodiesterase|uniref:metallophosphoesterase family protein n=1 Tax=Mycolicibacterium TaxID=1866885 RepID=UPI00096D5807|nr:MULTISPECIES: metallophosphoesterase [Mycolicibacterium]
MTTLKIAIVSDVHADEQENRWTRIGCEPPNANRNQHPLSDLQYVVDSESLRCDYLVVPGDITNQANAFGLSYAWRRLNELATALDARLLAVPGNHDIVTRAPTRDRSLGLKNLIPGFPLPEAEMHSSFWENGWFLVDEPDHRILLLDSTLGFPEFPESVDEESPAFAEYLTAVERGSITERVEGEVRDRLRSLDELKLNIAVVHHHPQEHQNHQYMQDSYGPMHRGTDLLDILSSNPRSGRWIVIHGHKHIPQLVHATTSTSNGPLILCSGSLGAKLWEPIDSVTRNQFHMLTATSDPASTNTSSLRGSVETFTWGFGVGWYRSDQTGSGLPPYGGFGCSDDFRSIAAQIKEVMASENLYFIGYAELIAKVPQLPFILPADIDFLEDFLDQDGYQFRRDRKRRIVQLVRAVT